jgi:peptidoglycan/xylan/chitin deacetylase (PgdA/CDA1 family)
VRQGRGAVKLAAAAFDVVRRPAVGLVVLIYHRVGRRTSIEVDLPLETFEQQIAFLAQRCHVVTLDAGIARLRARGVTDDDDDLVAITFDDGTADFADVAMPVLSQHGLPATLYASTRYIDAGIEFPDGGVPLSWAALRDVCSTGLVSVGSHTHTHALLDRIPADAVAAELDRSIDLIETNLEARPRHFAYPKAVLGSAEAQHAVRERFESAAVAGTRANSFDGSDVYRLARTPIQASDGMRWFEKKVRGGMELEDRFRRQINRHRYRTLQT